VEGGVERKMFLARKSSGNQKSKRKKYGGKNPQRPKPEEQGGMPQHRLRNSEEREMSEEQD
jgi:hypothetical protein